jgi:hypothetical protein
VVAFGFLLSAAMVGTFLVMFVVIAYALIASLLGL